MLRRSDVDLVAGTVRVQRAYSERSTGKMVLGPPKSRAGRRIVGIPRIILPMLTDHLAAYARSEPDALIFPGPLGGPLRRGNFNRQSGWPHAVAAIEASGLHFHDLRHAGNAWAATSGAGLRDLMARMGHDSAGCDHLPTSGPRRRRRDRRRDRRSRPGRAVLNQRLGRELMAR